jgi:hypothetical protein
MKANIITNESIFFPDPGQKNGYLSGYVTGLLAQANGNSKPENDEVCFSSGRFNIQPGSSM